MSNEDKPSIKFADQIVKEMDERGPVSIPDGCVTGEAFEERLCEERNKPKIGVIGLNPPKLIGKKIAEACMSESMLNVNSEVSSIEGLTQEEVAKAIQKDITILERNCMQCNRYMISESTGGGKTGACSKWICKFEPKQEKHTINNSKLLHMRAVAEFMYNEAPKYDLNPDEMYVLGFLHDIGYIGGKFKGHEKYGEELLGTLRYKHSHEIGLHGWYPGQNEIDESELSTEACLLLAADSSVDAFGNFVGYNGRRQDIEARYGDDKIEYLNHFDKRIEWLKNKGFVY